VRIISEEVGFEKPDPKIFQLSLERLQVESSRAVMVGNMLWEDIKGAENAGIRSIWLNNNEPQKDVAVHPDFEITDIEGVLQILTGLQDQ
jgi:putative hydrolase of the HAD superfamily